MLLHAVVALEETEVRECLVEALEEAGLSVAQVDAPAELGAFLAGRSVDLVVFGGMERMVTIAEGVRRHPDRPGAVAVVGDEDPAQRAELLAAGCAGVLNGRLPRVLLQTALHGVVGRLHRERRWREEGGAGQGALVTPTAREAMPQPKSRAMAEVLATAERVAASDSTLFLLGETGVGKEWVARRVHAASRRRDQPFVAINCAAVPDHLLESELFGHVKGAFTGATRARRGHFELAHGGTLFLDEIAEMQPHLQGKLLRAIQELEIQRVGGEDAVRVDVRLMAATSRGLEAALADGSFRSDLYYRLAVVTLTIPPLRARSEDVPALAAHYLDRFGRRAGRPEIRIPPPVMEALCDYPWPGNVRELVNVMERAVVLGEGDELRLQDLPVEMRDGESGAAAAWEGSGDGSGEHRATPPERWLQMSLRDARRAAGDWIEKRQLDAALCCKRGHIGASAELLGISPRSLHAKLKRHGLRKEDYR